MQTGFQMNVCSFLLGKYLGLELLAGVVTVHITLSEIANFFQIWKYFAIPPARYKSSCCFVSSGPLNVIPCFSLILCRSSNRCVAVYLSSFNFYPMRYNVEHSFLCLLTILIPSLVNVFFRSFASFLLVVIFILLIFEGTLYIMDTSPFSDRCL